MKKIFFNIVFIFLVFLFDSCVFQNNKEFTAMVVSGHPEASKIGLQILKRGGNAIDAAIAVQFALAVSYPIAGNLGGGGFMIYRTAEGKTYALDFREKAPEKAHREMYLNKEGEVMKKKSLYGGMAVGVPGTVDGIFEKYNKFGSLPFDSLIDPSIILAEKGFDITANQARYLNKYQDDFKSYNPDNNYFINDEGWKEGDLLIPRMIC